MFTRKLLVPAVLLLGFGLACAGGTTEEAPADATPAAAPVAATTLQGAGTLASPYVLSCDNSAKDIVGAPGLKAHVTCPANCTTGSVWGVNPYTRDSRVCTAAVHSGAIPVTGGTAEMVKRHTKAAPATPSPAAPGVRTTPASRSRSPQPHRLPPQKPHLCASPTRCTSAVATAGPTGR
jgi:LCCL domain